MPLDDLFATENAAAARDLIARPLPPPPKPAKFSAWSAIPRAVAVAAGEVGASAADLAGAAIAFRDAPRSQLDKGGLPTAAFSSELGDSVRDYWRTLKPDPETASTAEQVLFGFSRGLAKLIPATIAAGPAGAIAVGIEEAMTVSDDLRRQGVPDGARQAAGIIQGTGMAAAALPLLGRTLGETAALYVAGGPGGFMAQQALTRKVLEHAGQERIAGSYDPFDPVGLTIAAALPLAFTAAGLRAQKLRADAKAQADFIAGPRPSEPTPVAAAAAEAVRAPELSPEVVDAAMVNHLRVAQETLQTPPAAPVVEAGTLPAAVAEADPWQSAAPRPLPEPAAIADDLRSLGRGAGWAQEGGSIVRDTPRIDGSMSEAEIQQIHMQGDVVGRTKWIPFEGWYAQMRAELGKGGLSKPQAIQDAIEKAIDGKPLKAAERRTVDWLRAEVQRMDDALLTLDDAAEVGQDARALGLGRADAVDVVITSRAAEIDAQAVESAAIRFEDDDAAFMAEMRRIVGDEEATRIEAAAADNANAGARPGGAQAAAAQGKAADPLATLNEPAGTAPKPLAGALPDAIAARVAELEATQPDLVVRVDSDGRHVTLADDLAEVRRLAAEGTDDALGTLDADLLQVAVNCALASGG